MSEGRVQKAACNCGNPDDVDMVHYDQPGYHCEYAGVESLGPKPERGETIVSVSQHISELIEGKVVAASGGAVITGTSDPKKVMEIMQQPHVNVERCGPRHVNLEVLNIPNDQALRVVYEILPTALELYLKKSKDYGGNVMDRFGLGPKAAVPDLTRKFGKIIDAVWHDKPLQFEQVDEVLRDLFGHILIILDQLTESVTDPKVTDR